MPHISPQALDSIFNITREVIQGKEINQNTSRYYSLFFLETEKEVDNQRIADVIPLLMLKDDSENYNFDVYIKGYGSIISLPEMPIVLDDILNSDHSKFAFNFVVRPIDGKYGFFELVLPRRMWAYGETFKLGVEKLVDLVKFKGSKISSEYKWDDTIRGLDSNGNGVCAEFIDQFKESKIVIVNEAASFQENDAARQLEETNAIADQLANEEERQAEERQQEGEGAEGDI